MVKGTVKIYFTSLNKNTEDIFYSIEQEHQIMRMTLSDTSPQIN